MKTGKVLRMYKTKWFKDECVNKIEDSKVYILKRMRIGNSTLKSHCGSGLSKRCKNCVKNENETNEHYLLKCPKFNEERKEMMENIRISTNVNENLPVSTLLGFYPMKEFGKKRIKQEQMTSIIQNVIKYKT